jgi:PIN domain nuclease of toxin-antitoxin system
MRLLLDTHIALWAVTANARLSAQARALIIDADEVRVSVASLWEIAIMHALARGDMPVSASLAHQAFSDAGYLVLDIRPAHALALETLPPWHKDPFDRLLVAQAITEPLRLLTADAVLREYSELVVVV